MRGDHRHHEYMKESDNEKYITSHYGRKRYEVWRRYTHRLTAGCFTIELPRITSFIISTTSMIIDYVMLFCQYIFYNFYRLESFFCDLNSESKFYSAILLQCRSISPLYINLFIVIHIQMISGIYIFILVIYASKPF